MKCFPSGKIIGQRLVVTSPAGPTTWVGLELGFAATRKMPPVIFGANKIVSSGSQVPPRGLSAIQMSKTGPPPTATRFSIPPAKNPIDFPSWDQKGYSAASVPGTGFASLLLSERTKI